jgi:hypothetical protein
MCAPGSYNATIIAHEFNGKSLSKFDLMAYLQTRLMPTDFLPFPQRLSCAIAM